MRRHSSAWVLLGAIVFVSDASWGSGKRYTVEPTSAPVTGTAPVLEPVVISTTSLAEPTTMEALLAAEPFVSPLGTAKAKMVSGFGKREIKPEVPAPDPTPPTPQFEPHEGVDFGALAGTIVRAARSGKVIFAGFSKMYVSRKVKTDQHRFIIIRHADGQSSRYVHLSGLRVKPGQDVTSGQPLGTLADSDERGQPVLHFEIRDVQGRTVDPLTLITAVKKP